MKVNTRKVKTVFRSIWLAPFSIQLKFYKILIKNKYVFYQEYYMILKRNFEIEYINSMAQKWSSVRNSLPANDDGGWLVGGSLVGWVKLGWLVGWLVEVQPTTLHLLTVS